MPMFVILVYDVEQKRVAKVLKKCREYLFWVQNSVFEGELTEMKLRQLRENLKLLSTRNMTQLSFTDSSQPGIVREKSWDWKKDSSQWRCRA